MQSPDYVIGEPEAETLREQAESSTIVLLSMKKCDVPYTDGEKACDGVEVAFGVAARMEVDFTLTQTVPLPPGMDFNSIGNRMDQVVEIARAALCRRFRKLAERLEEQSPPSSHP